MRIWTRLAVAAVGGLALVFAGCDQAGPNRDAEPSGTPATTTTSTPAGPRAAATPRAVFEVPTIDPEATATANLHATAGESCGPQPSAAFLPGETTTGTVSSGGRERTYLIHVPPSYDGSQPVPLVLNFHGLGSTGAQQHAYSGLVPIAEREGFLLVSPDGVNNSWLIAAGVNDIEFTRDLVAELANTFCIDRGAVFSTGMSNGGFMSAALACVAGDIVAAVAPVAGVLAASPNCREPVPFLQFHGKDDHVVPYEGGTITATGGPFAGIERIMAGWAMHNGCEGEPRTSEAAPLVNLVEFEGCEAPTAHYVVVDGGHSWPGASPVPRLGRTTQAISASELMWEFFVANRR